MDAVDWVDASLCQQRSLNSVYQRDTDDRGVNPPYSIYSHADARNSDGEPLEDEGNAELTRKINVLRAIEERILHKKAAILIKAIEMIKKTETPDFKGATLRDRVTTILQQRHSLNFRSKGETNWSPTERDDSPSHSTVLLEDHHPLKLRVKAVMKHRVCDPSGFTSKSPVSDHEMATRPTPPPPPSKSICSQILEESVTNKGFECFLNLLNKGVDMDLLSRIVNDDSEDLHLEDQPFNSEPSGVTEDSDLPTSSERLQFNSGPHLSENSGDRTELPTREQSPKETNSLPDDNKNGNDSLSSSSRSKSPLTMEKTKKEEKEMSKVDEQNEQLQNILNTLGLRLEVEDLSKLTDRTQERLYGKRNESMPVAASRTEEQSPVTTTGSCKIDRKSSSSSPSSFSSSRSCSRSPSYRQLAQSRESQDRHKKESFSAGSGSRKSREELSSLYITQDDIQARTTVGKNKGDDIFNEIPYFHSHCDPTLSACPDYTLPHYSHYDTTYSSDTSSYWTSTPGVSTTPHYPSSSPYSMDTNHSHHAIPSVRHDRDSLENVFFVNPDLSMSEGQFGSISGPRNLQVVNMKHPLGYCLPRMTGAMSLDKEQSDQEKTKRLKLLEEQVQDVQTLGSHWDNNIPFVAKHIKASGKKVEPTHGQKDKSKKKQTPTDEEIKANLRKKLEAFNQMSKNKSHAQPNPYSDTQCEPVGMKICTSKCETMVLSRKRVECPLQVGDEILHKYLGVLYTSEGKMEREIKKWIGAASAVMQTLYWYVVVKELSRKAKLSIYRSMYIPTLTYGCELWVVTERTRSRIHAAEMSFLRRVSGLSLRDRVRSSVMRWALLVGGASMLSDGGGGGGAGEACWVEGVGLGVVRALWSGSGPPWVMRGRCRPPGWVPCWTSWLTRPLPCEGGSPFLDVPAQQLRTPVD